MPFLWNEFAAIKTKLAGLTVSDETAGPIGRSVPVRYRLPESEVADSTFPQIIIDVPVITKASDREHRGPIYLPYVPEGVSAPVTGIDRDLGQMVPNWDPSSSSVDQSPFYVPEYPIPFDFDFTITVASRKQNHLTQLMVQLAQINYLPARFGYLEVPQDGTTRSLFLMGGPEVIARKDGDTKRLFQAVYMVRVASEMSLYQYQQLTETDLVLDVITNVNLDVEQI